MTPAELTPEPASEGTTSPTEADDHRPAGPAPSRSLEIGVSFGTVLVFGGVLYLAITLPLRAEAAPGQIDARFWPTLLAGTGLVIAVGRLITSTIAAPEERRDLDARRPGGFRRVLLTLLITAAFVAVWSVGEVVLVGYRIQLFPIAMVVYLVALLALHGARGWKPFVLFPIPLALGTYLLFGILLRIPL
ncbi:tripartite tricarboxylate transporter TctB family protein [Brachybacterium sacelli]|uniref:DUF1468 domain-containing protein n=1 Tax=Brachybacterium sacelli TaxID=173364 RepID=A0ABS4WZD4_9MICO|nr:tripartite tricarboxylate transporter TctB family protein [Brachybacterium sacelli]MBP2381574.1 hypothetical protein [Brachybacterium sacelli]